MAKIAELRKTSGRRKGRGAAGAGRREKDGRNAAEATECGRGGKEQYQTYPLLYMRPMVARWLVQPPKEWDAQLPTEMDGAGEEGARPSSWRCRRWTSGRRRAIGGDTLTHSRKLSFTNVSRQER